MIIFYYNNMQKTVTRDINWRNLFCSRKKRKKPNGIKINQAWLNNFDAFIDNVFLGEVSYYVRKMLALTSFLHSSSLL